MRVPTAIQFAAEHLWVQTKCNSQFLLGIATCTKILLNALAKCTDIHVYSTSYIYYSHTGIPLTLGGL